MKITPSPAHRKLPAALSLLLVAASFVFAQGAQYAKNKALRLAAMRGSAGDVRSELAAGLT